jgi:hypothetical protein
MSSFIFGEASGYRSSIEAVRSSVISLVAIFATMTVAPMTSAGRFSPLGPLGIYYSDRATWHYAL